MPLDHPPPQADTAPLSERVNRGILRNLPSRPGRNEHKRAAPAAEAVPAGRSRDLRRAGCGRAEDQHVRVIRFVQESLSGGALGSRAAYTVRKGLLEKNASQRLLHQRGCDAGRVAGDRRTRPVKLLPRRNDAQQNLAAARFRDSPPQRGRRARRAIHSYYDSCHRRYRGPYDDRGQFGG